ncbi:hypothetical protein DFJ74DRAFT_636467 [Hyaloraphidium curvatum]|nr:hypothetical protein DFJ74DRAFT_636467 [Hyaloraphidium curvatum]
MPVEPSSDSDDSSVLPSPRSLGGLLPPSSPTTLVAGVDPRQPAGDAGKSGTVIPPSAAPLSTPAKGKKTARQGPKASKAAIVEDPGHLDLGAAALPPSCAPVPLYAVYLLHSKSPSFKGHAYVGSTPDPQRRLRQHNGEVKGGAWRTGWGKGRKRPWEFALIVHNFPNAYLALQFEWALQNPHMSRFLRPCAQPHFAPAFPHPAESRVQNRIPAKMRAISDLLRSPYWRHRGLDIHFVASWAPEAWEEAGCPPLSPLTRITYGAIEDIAPRKRDADKGMLAPLSPAAHIWPGEQANAVRLRSGALEPMCVLCPLRIDASSPNSYLLCSNDVCRAPAAHITCLAEEFLAKPFGAARDPLQIVPGAGSCPACGTVARWADLVAGMRRRVGFPKATRKPKAAKAAGSTAAPESESESEDEELPYPEDTDSEDDVDVGSFGPAGNDMVAACARLPPLALPSKQPPAKSRQKGSADDLVSGLESLNLGSKRTGASAKENQPPRAATDPGPTIGSSDANEAAPSHRSNIGATRRRIMDERMRNYALSTHAQPAPVQPPPPAPKAPAPKATLSGSDSDSSPESTSSGSFRSAVESPPQAPAAESGSEDDADEVINRLRGLLKKLGADD